MPDSLEQEVKLILSRLTGLDVGEISDTANVVDDLGIDSLKIIEIATEIERTYKVAVKDSELGKLRTVKDAVSFLRELIARKNG
ncbi:MAG: acyl carrier protein [Candidatus Omnitrophota bacterium]|nr:acyl carrier protein [Candidatus Omnitrophota bacterium]